MTSIDPNTVTVSEETALAFLPTKLRKSGGIDLKKLAATARKAMEGSERSLAAAGNIANTTWVSTQWTTGKFAKNVVESIGYVRDLSEANLALSAVCNDLAAAHELQAHKFDAHHHQTSALLHEVAQKTADLLAHLRAARASALLQPIVQGLEEVDGADRDALHGWLQLFSEGVDEQYLALQNRLDALALRPVVLTDDLDPLHQKLSRLGNANQAHRDRADRLDLQLGHAQEDVRTLDAELTRQLRQLDLQVGQHASLAAEHGQALAQLAGASRAQHDHTGNLQAKVDEHAEQLLAQAAELATALAQEALQRGADIERSAQHTAERHRMLDATLRQSHEKLSHGLAVLNQRFDRVKTQVETDLATLQERNVALMARLENQGHSTAGSIAALDERWRRRLWWVAGALGLVQIATLAYLVIRP